MTTAFDPGAPWLLQRARLAPDGAALVFEERTWTWTALADESAALAARLAALGVGRGDIVAVHLRTHPRLVALLHAAQSLGAALLPLNTRLNAAEAARLVEHARPRILLLGGDAQAQALATAAREVRSLDVFAELDRAQPARAFAPLPRLDPDAALTVVYTSGTTKTPKGVVLASAQHCASAAASRARLGHGAGDAWLAAMPLFHVGGLAVLTRSVLEGSRVLLEASFDGARVASALQSGEASMVALVPTMLSRVMDELRGVPSPRLRTVLVGGAALPSALGRRALDAGLPIAATWGLTETCSQVCTTRPGSAEAARGLVGVPLDGTAIRLDHSDREGVGEILVQGPTVMRGYLHDDAATQAAMPQGWLRTGDLGRFHEADAPGGQAPEDSARKGHALQGSEMESRALGAFSLEVVGRTDDLVITGGENVAPAEVERVLEVHEAVAECAVLGVPDDEWGQTLVALVVLREGAEVTEDALRAWCRRRLAGYKIPRRIAFTAALPLGATGKVERRRLRWPVP